jgi:hypothetical protein
MKKSLLILATLALASTPVFAKKIAFPNAEHALFSITIPDSWEPDKDDDDTLEALSPKENVYLAAWELKDKSDIASVDKDIIEMLKDHAKAIKMDGEGVPAKPGGMDGMLFKGTAKDKEDGSDIEFFALLVSPKPGKVAIIFIEAAADTPKDEADKLQKILESLTPAKAE